MSVHLTGKFKNLLQKKGLFQANTELQNNDIGYIGEYLDTVTKYTGLIRSNSDLKYYLFDSLTENPFITNTVNTSALDFNLANMVLNGIEINTISIRPSNSQSLKIFDGVNDYLVIDTLNEININLTRTQFNNGVNFNGENNDIFINDNTANALNISQGANNYMNFSTINGNETITVSKKINVNAPSYLNSGFRVGVQTISANTTLDTNYHIVEVDTTSGNVTLTAPTLSGNSGRFYKIIKAAGSNNVTFRPSTGQMLNGVINDTITLYNVHDHTTVYAGNNSWYA